MNFKSSKNKKSASQKNCTIIGAGISSLALAIRMAAKGHKVQVIEKNKYAGGKMHEWRADGFRFDIGPSIFTLPELADELFKLAGKNPKDYFDYVQLDPVFKYFFNDGTIIEGKHTKEKMSEEIAQKTDISYQAAFKYLKDLETKFNLTEKVFLHSSIHKFKNYFTLKSLKGFINLRKVEFFRSMDQANQKKLPEKNIKTLFNSFASYIGSNPYKTPATLNLIAHIQIDKGTYFVTEGMAQLAKALYKLAQELNVKFALEESVTEIELVNKKAKAVKTDKNTYPSDIIISGIDVYNVYKKLLPQSVMPKISIDQPRSNSALVFLWGMNKKFDQFIMHNMIYPSNPEGEFNAIFSTQKMTEDSSIYLYISSKVNTSDAIANGENWFVYIKTPENKGQDWEAITKQTRARVIKKFNTLLGEDIEKSIVYEKNLDPIFYQNETNAAYGSIYGTQNNGFRSSWKKHANFSADIEGLYFCGGTVHPGPGVPLALLSAKITSELID